MKYELDVEVVERKYRDKHGYLRRHYYVTIPTKIVDLLKLRHKQRVKIILVLGEGGS